MSSAGTTSTRARATSLPLLVNLCTRPAGTTTVSPAVAMIFRRPSRNVIVPSSTWKRSSCSGCTCAPGTRPSAESSSSNSSSAPPVSAAVWMKVMRSPLTGLSIVCPEKAIGRSPWRSLGSERQDSGTRRRRVVGPPDDLLSAPWTIRESAARTTRRHPCKLHKDGRICY